MSKIVYTPILKLGVPANVAAYIDIAEVIPIRAGVRVEEPFVYNRGDPPANRFELDWFLTPPPAPNEQYAPEDDPRQEVRSRLDYIEALRRGENPNSQNFVTGLPTYEIIPAVPQLEDGEQDGILVIQASEKLPYSVLYPKLIILGQQDSLVETESIAFDSISQEISTPEENPYEPVRPIWEK